MAFAEIKTDLKYWKKQDKPLYADLAWNIPEQKTGRVNIVGGNSQGFAAVVRMAESLGRKFPVREVRLFLPDALCGKLPPVANVDYVISTESGSIGKSAKLVTAFSQADFTILAGDMSRNAETAVAVTEAISGESAKAGNLDKSDMAGGAKAAEGGEVPLLVTRDAVDLLAPSAEKMLARPGVILLASMAQLQKVFRAVYYPRMIMLSQPLLPVVETLHKFTLSYYVTIVTLHEGQVIVAKGGEVVTTPLERTGYSPISIWSGELAVKIAGMNLYNLGKMLEATVAALGD